VLSVVDFLPKIADFGLAKWLGVERGLTASGMMAGTPGYMAPEQAGGGRKVGPAADVYGLGAILYELLTGRPPFLGSTQLETLSHVLEQEPVPPRQLQPRTPRDLNVICLRCLEKDPGRRFPSALALAEDLARFRGGEPVLSRPVGLRERAWKWARRRPALAGLLLGLVLVTVLGLAGVSAALVYALAGWSEADAQRQSARQERDRAREARDQAHTARTASRRQSAGLMLDRALELAERHQVDQAVHWLLAALREAPDETEADRAFHRLVRTHLASWGPCLHRPVAAVEAEGVSCLAFSPSGRLLATGHMDGTIRLWRARTGRPTGVAMRHDHAVASLAFSPDGRTLLAGYGRWRWTQKLAGQARLWDVASGKAVGPALPHRLAREQSQWPVAPVGWGADGKTLLTCQEDELFVWDATTRRHGPPWQLKLPARALAVAGDGRSLLLTLGRATPTDQGWAGEGEVQLWDVHAGKLLAVPIASPGEGLGTLAWSRDGRTILTGGEGGPVLCRRWDPETNRPRGAASALPVPGRPHLTPDGRMAVLCGSLDGQVRFWDLSAGREGGTPLRPFWAAVAALHPDGEHLWRGGEVWRLARPLSRAAPAKEAPAFPARGSGRQVLGVLFSRDRNLVVTADTEGRAEFHDADGRGAARAAVEGLARKRPHPDAAYPAALSPDGSRLAGVLRQGGHASGLVTLLDVATRKPVCPPLPHLNQVGALAFSPDGKTLAVGTYAWTVHLYDTATGKPRGQPLPQRDIVLSLAFSPDGRRLAAGTASDWNNAPETRLWDLGGAASPVALPQDDYVLRLAFRPDGRALLTGSRTSVCLWDAGTGKPLCPPVGCQGLADRAGFSPDGRWFLCGGSDGTVQVRSASGGALAGPLLRGPAAVTDAAFSPDARTVLVGYTDGSARLWDLATFRPLGAPVVQGRPLLAVAWLPDGKSFLTTADDGRTRLWPMPAPLTASVERIEAALEILTTLRMDPAQREIVPLDRQSWQERFRAWREQGGSFDAVVGPLLADAVWHEARARDAEEDGDAAGARWHRARLPAAPGK
jgi:WD40 repeat protein